jgi:hypothetical protein
VNDLQQASAWADALTAAGVDAYTDPRGATPPCVLIVPPSQTFDTDCAALCEWRVYSLAPGPGNVDAWAALAAVQPFIVDLLPVITRLYVAVSLSPDNPPFPAFCYLFNGSVEI